MMWNAVLDTLLPPRCAACGDLGEGLCPRCLAEAAVLRLPAGGPEHLADGVLAVAAFRYDGVVAEAIRDVKTPGRHAAAVALGDLLWSQVTPIVGAAAEWTRTWVPSTTRRLRMRGADIPRLLAGPNAIELAERVAQRSDQTALSGRQRRVARSSDFVCRRSAPPHVVLVDDVRTTGATSLAVARALIQAGAVRVLVVTLAAVVREPACNDVY